MSNQAKLGQPIVLAVTIAAGFGIVWALLCGWVVEVRQSWLGANQVVEVLRFRPDGTPLIESFPSSHYESRQFRDLQGNPIVLSVREQWITGANLDTAYGPRKFLGRLPWSWRVRSFSDGAVRPSYWYLVHDGRADGSAYFVGYDVSNNVRVGYLGTAGFRQDGVPTGERFHLDARWFQSSQNVASVHPSLRGSHPYPIYQVVGLEADEIPTAAVFLLADDTLYEVDLRERSVRTAFRAEPNSTVSIDLLTRYTAGSEWGRHWLALRMVDRIIVLNHKGERLRDTAIPPSLQKETFTWYETSRGEAIARVSKYNLEIGTTQERLYWINHQGAVVRSEQLQLQSGAPALGGEYEESLLACLCPAPIAVNIGAVAVEPIVRLRSGEADKYRTALAQSLARLAPALLGVHLLAAILAWVSYRRQKRYAASTQQTVAWCIFVFLFGLPGLVGYLFHRRWPVLQPCPACTETVPHDRRACASCGAEFPEPAQTGIEVFA